MLTLTTMTHFVETQLPRKLGYHTLSGFRSLKELGEEEREALVEALAEFIHEEIVRIK